jgi:hypothetical protein
MFPFLVFAHVLTPPTNCSFVVVYSIRRYILLCSYSQKEGKIQRQKKAEGPFYISKIKNVSKQSNTRESNVKLGLEIKEKEEPVLIFCFGLLFLAYYIRKGSSLH